MSATAIPTTVDALIQRELPAARIGDQVAYGRIVAACQNTITAVALAITRDVSASEDIAQDAFISAWQHLERLQNPDSFLPWLRQIARNLARDHLRKHRDQAMDGPNAELAMAMAADPGPQPMQQLLETEHEIAAAELIAALPEDSRETLLLFYREGQSSQQVALLLGITDAAVRKRLSRARQHVREELLTRFGDFARSSAPSAAFVASVTAGIAVLGKPASAAAATLGSGAAVAGSAVAGKAILGSVGLLDGGVIGGALSLYIYRRFLLGFADTLEERRTITRTYNLYLISSLTLGLFAGMGIVLFEHFWLAATLTMLGMAVYSYQSLMVIGRVMKPFLERDAARRPQGAARRQLIYRLSFGPSGVFIGNLIVIASLLFAYGQIAH
jgi:RNA polymerase sigma factor (sigma-70 family)